MPSDFDLRAFLESRRIRVDGAIVRDSDPAGRALALIRVKRDFLGRQEPNNKFLKQVQAELAALGNAVEFSLIDEDRLDAENGVRATLLHAFETEIRNVFLTTAGGTAVVWIDPKSEIEEGLLTNIRTKIVKALIPFGLTLGEVHTMEEATLASRLACLRVIRQAAPATSSSISLRLQSAGFTIPSDDWLARRLTSLTREGRVVRRADGSFALTAGALRDLGSAKGKKSPDIARMLALAKGRH